MGYDHGVREEWEIEDPKEQGFSFWMTIEGWRLYNFLKAAKRAGVEIRDSVSGEGMTSVYCRSGQDMTAFWDELNRLEAK